MLAWSAVFRGMVFRGILCAGLSLVLCACGSGGGGGSAAVDEPLNHPPAPPDNNYVYGLPLDLNDGWVVAQPEDEAMDTRQIEAMINDIRDRRYTGIDSVTLVRNGRLLLDVLIRTELGSGDHNAGNTDLRVHNVYSVTKSITSALLGIALARGVVSSLDEFLYDQFPQYSPFDNWDDRKATTTIRHFLTMQHGLDWDELSFSYSDSRNSLIHAMDTCSDWVQCFLDLPTVTEPGGEFAYSTHASLTLGSIIQERSGMPLETFADQYLFEPLGVVGYLWGQRTPAGRVRAGSGLLMTGRDMAKFGQLYLNLGLWDGQQLLAGDWVNESVQQHLTLPTAWRSRGYGYQWWLDSIESSEGTRTGYHAEGYGGQFIFIFPDLALIAVFTGSNYAADDNPAQPYDLLRRYIFPAVH